MAFGRVLVVFLEETRTFRRPRPDDLREVRRLALSEMERFLYAAGSPPGKYSLYADRLVAICLAQGAAQHLVDLDAAGAYDNEVRVDESEVRDKGLRVLPDGRVLSGVKDLDVVFFFPGGRPAAAPNQPASAQERRGGVADPGAAPALPYEEGCARGHAGADRWRPAAGRREGVPPAEPPRLAVPLAQVRDRAPPARDLRRTDLGYQAAGGRVTRACGQHGGPSGHGGYV